MSSLGAQKSGPAYWRSLEELADSPEFRQWVQGEFPESAFELADHVSRRQFVKLMGASLGLAGLAGCRWPQEKILPFARNPEDWVPGTTKEYATAMELGGVGRGLLVTSYDGRPIKIEGNPQHPESHGACDALAQASILELYDPDRSKNLVRRERGQQLDQTWDDFTAFAGPHFADLWTGGAAGLVVLSEDTSSPSVLDMRTRLLAALPQAQWLTYEPLSRDNEREGARLAFGRPLRTHYALDRAEVIVTLDADLLLSDPAAIRHAGDFAHGRRADDRKMNRLYVVESALSLTGAAADHRLPVRPSEILPFAFRLAAELFTREHLALPPALDRMAGVLERWLVPNKSGEFIPAVAHDLLAHRGTSVIAVGPRQPAVVHAIGHLLNAALDNVRSTVTYTEEPDPQRISDLEAMRTLVDDMRGGRVNTLLIVGGNPVYNAPADVDLVGALKNVNTTIHLSPYDDETSRVCRWHLPRAHYLESWGDTRSFDGMLSIIQPLIEPLYGGKSTIEVLALITGDQLTKGYDLVRRSLQPMLGNLDFESKWRRMLHDGVLADSAFARVTPEFDGRALMEELAKLDRLPSVDRRGLELLFTPDPSVYDGRFANNGWLQELPNPLTKLSWDNAALFSPQTAGEIGIVHGDVVRVELDGRSLEAPVYVMPGQAAGAIALALGYGRPACGGIGTDVGVNAYALRTMSTRDIAPAVRVTKTGKTYSLACTQDHHAIDTVGRKEQESRISTLVREAELAEYLAHPDFARHGEGHPPLVSLFNEHEYVGHRWAMAIDLSVCIGCNACVIACQAENNIPIVGKDNVARGREMHWIRVDRYFSGNSEAPAVVYQPVACQQCENAPCEQVCPVAATVHDAEGLNVMVYNRCVGTRYCSNNCPYKVRRFNFFDYHKHTAEVTKMMHNPDVTVRSRGVMEKCTFCIQRISAVKIAAKNDRRLITDGEIIPACAQTCPTQAIVFGDLNDPDSRVTKLHEHQRAYAMLEELNVKPRTKYLAKLRNRSAKPVNIKDETI